MIKKQNNNNHGDQICSLFEFGTVGLTYDVRSRMPCKRTASYKSMGEVSGKLNNGGDASEKNARR